MGKSLEELKAKRDVVKRQVKLEEFRGRERGRKNEARRRYLLGAMLSEEMEQDDEVKTQLLAKLDVFLDRPADRGLFGLEPETKEADPNDNPV